MQDRTWHIILASVILVQCSVIVALWQNQLDLRDTNAQAVRDFYSRLAHAQIEFSDSGNIIFPDEQKFFDEKEKYEAGRENFIEINLRSMQLTLYESGAPIKNIQVLTKGRDGGWWETPTGTYTVLSKELNHFSSIGYVWMPYSVQFFGNFFIHGWPHYDDGTPVPQSYSGGCVRVSNEDARAIFDFATKNMPVVVLEDHATISPSWLQPRITNVVLPPISANAFLITDLSSGETIVEKNADSKLPIASLVKLMTGVTAHELVYLGRPIRISKPITSVNPGAFHANTGEYYTGFELLYPLLMQSSNDTADILASIMGIETFVRNMNTKALSIGMRDTHFADASGISAQNISTANDVVKLIYYIYHKRRFLFDISRGEVFEYAGIAKIGDTLDIPKLKNFNEFAKEPDLIGMKNGETSAAGQTIATVWNLKTAQGNTPVAIIILNSQNRVKDMDNLLRWLKNNFEVL